MTSRTQKPQTRTDAVRQSRRPHRRPRLAAIAGDGGAALQDEAGVAGVLDGGTHQEFGVRQSPGGVVHVARVRAVHDWWTEKRINEEL